MYKNIAYISAKTDYCSTCFDFKVKIINSKNIEEKNDILHDFQDHKNLAQNTR